VTEPKSNVSNKVSWDLDLFYDVYFPYI